MHFQLVDIAWAGRWLDVFWDLYQLLWWTLTLYELVSAASLFSAQKTLHVIARLLAVISNCVRNHFSKWLVYLNLIPAHMSTYGIIWSYLLDLHKFRLLKITGQALDRSFLRKVFLCCLGWTASGLMHFFHKRGRSTFGWIRHFSMTLRASLGRVTFLNIPL